MKSLLAYLLLGLLLTPANAEQIAGVNGVGLSAGIGAGGVGVVSISPRQDGDSYDNRTYSPYYNTVFQYWDGRFWRMSDGRWWGGHQWCYGTTKCESYPSPVNNKRRIH